MARVKAAGLGISLPAAAAVTFAPFTTHIGAAMAQSSVPKIGPGTGAGTANTIGESLLNAKLEAVEARTETKFAQLLGELKVVSATISNLDGKFGALDRKIDDVDKNTKSAKAVIITTVISTAIGLAALAVAGAQIFQGGLGLGVSAFQAAASVDQVSRGQAEQGEAPQGSRPQTPERK